MTGAASLLRLLARYGIDTAFCTDGADWPEGEGLRLIPSPAPGAMALGFARGAGAVGVVLGEDAPALAEAERDSLPLITISTAPGGLEAETLDDIPRLLAFALAQLSSTRPRGIALSIPQSLLTQTASEWPASNLPMRPEAAAGRLPTAAGLLKDATTPVILLGGGAAEAAGDLIRVVARSGAVVISTPAAKGILPDDHPLHLPGTIARPEVVALLARADVVLALGTTLPLARSFQEGLPGQPTLIRIDIDPTRMLAPCPADLPIIGDAAPAMADLAAFLADHDCRRQTQAGEAEVARIKAAISAEAPTLFTALRAACPRDTIFIVEEGPLAESGALHLPVFNPFQWITTAPGMALGQAIGAKLAQPDKPVVVLTKSEEGLETLPTAKALGLPLPVLIGADGAVPERLKEALSEALKASGPTILSMTETG